jgi:hypothetical protein
MPYEISKGRSYMSSSFRGGRHGIPARIVSTWPPGDAVVLSLTWDTTVQPPRASIKRAGFFLTTGCGSDFPASFNSDGRLLGSQGRLNLPQCPDDKDQADLCSW